VVLGVSLGLVVWVLSLTRYRLLIREQSLESYAIIVAIVFLAVGVWAGVKMRDRRSAVTSGEPPDMMAVGERGELSEREAEVLVMMAKGLTNQEIAEAMFVSVNTVKTHTSNIFSKLNVGRRMHAVQKAVDLGLLTQPDDKR